jgi:hypothetical protein
MGIAYITTLHALGTGKLELSPTLEAESSSLSDSSRMACIDGDQLWAMPLTTALESSSSGGRHKLSKWSAMNSRSPNRMGSSWVSSTMNKQMWPVAMVGLCRMNHQNIQRKSMIQIPLLGVPTVSVFCTDKI